MSGPIAIRRATPDDAASIVAIWQVIVAEKDHSAVDEAFTVEGERAYIESLSQREGVFLAQAGDRVIGFQTLDRFVTYAHSMDHVGQLGTFVLREWRGQGIARQLAEHTLAFARAAGFEKLVIYVRAKNQSGQQFYASLGFRPCGRLGRQVKIAGEYDDEILMELFI